MKKTYELISAHTYIKNGCHIHIYNEIYVGAEALEHCLEKILPWGGALITGSPIGELH